EFLHFASRIRRMMDDIVKRDHAAALHQWGVHLEVLLDTGVRVVSIDEKEVESPSLKEIEDPVASYGVVRICLEQLYPLARLRERLVDRNLPVAGSFKVDTQQRGAGV